MTADLEGRTVLVTGAKTGIGRATAEALAGRGAEVFLAGRSPSRTQAVIDEIAARTGNDRLRFLMLDLGELDSVRAAAEGFLPRAGRCTRSSTTPDWPGSGD